MNKAQTKTLKIFLLLACSILLGITSLFAFVLYQKQLSSHGDYLDKLVANQYISWAIPTITVLVGIGVTALVLFVGLWKIQKTPENNNLKNPG